MVRCRHLCAATISYVVMTAGAVVAAAEDDFIDPSLKLGSSNSANDVEADPPQLIFRRANIVRRPVRILPNPLNARQRLVEVALDVNEENQIDKWIFGYDSKVAEVKLRELIERRVRQISNRYNLSSEKRRKLTLLAQADLYRILNETQRLRRRYRRFEDDAEEVADIRREAMLLRQTQADLLGVGSFFSKSASSLLQSDPVAVQFAELSDSQFLQYFSHIENAIRAIEVVPLQQSQRDQLVELLLTRIHPSKDASRDDDSRSYDDDIAKYRLSTIPEQTMLSIFSQEQWREIGPLLDGYRTFGPWLVRRGLIEPPNEISVNNLPDATQSADATVPANRAED